MTASHEPIAFNRATLAGRELEHVADAMRSGRTSANGPYSQRAAALLQEETGSAGVLLTSSCTSALEMSALLVDLKPGDTVIVPSFTFVTSALAFVRAGARLLFCDIEPETLGLDPRHLTELLDDSVRAVVPVHYAGVACDLPGLQTALADRPDVVVIEDAAHALFGRWQGRALGNFGRFATLSFHETKNIVCGEGGALLVRDQADLDRAWTIYDKGTNRRAFFQGQVDKYTWQDIGSSFGLSDTLAAHLWGQLEERAAIQAKRRHLYERYAALLAEPAAEWGLTLPSVPAGAEPAYHLFHLLLADAAGRPRLLEELKAHGIGATFHYVPLHDSPGGARFAARPTECPVTSDVAARLLRLPFHNALTDDDQDRVVATLLAALRGQR